MFYFFQKPNDSPPAKLGSGRHMTSVTTIGVIGIRHRRVNGDRCGGMTTFGGDSVGVTRERRRRVSPSIPFGPVQGRAFLNDMKDEKFQKRKKNQKIPEKIPDARKLALGPTLSEWRASFFYVNKTNFALLEKKRRMPNDLTARKTKMIVSISEPVLGYSGGCGSSEVLKKGPGSSTYSATAVTSAGVSRGPATGTKVRGGRYMNDGDKCRPPNETKKRYPLPNRGTRSKWF